MITTCFENTKKENSKCCMEKMALSDSCIIVYEGGKKRLLKCR